MFISFDYICKNQECSEFNKPHERLHAKDEIQTCKTCGKILDKMPCGPKQPHVSWSLWRV
jgi:hypothetical protein